MKRKRSWVVAACLILCSFLSTGTIGVRDGSAAPDPTIELAMLMVQEAVSDIDFSSTLGAEAQNAINDLLVSVQEGDYLLALQSAESLRAALVSTEQEEIVPECATSLIPVVFDVIGLVQGVLPVLQGNTSYCAVVEIPLSITGIIDGLLSYQICVAELEETPDQEAIAVLEQQQNAVASVDLILIYGQIRSGCFSSPQQGYIQLLLKVIGLLF